MQGTHAVHEHVLESCGGGENTAMYATIAFNRCIRHLRLGPFGVQKYKYSTGRVWTRSIPGLRSWTIQVLLRMLYLAPSMHRVSSRNKH